MASRGKRSLFKSARDRIWHKVNGWKEKKLSQAGKMILLKSVVQAIPSYSMSVFRLPLYLCHDLSGLSSRFWWGRKRGKKGVHWLKWSSLCQNKKNGGLGFRDFVEFNQALLAKQCWRLFASPDLLVSQIYKCKYYPESSFLEARVGRSSSLIWRSLLWGRKLLLSGLRWRVGDGTSILIYQDAWVPIPYSFKIMSPPNLLVNRPVSYLISNGSWNFELISGSFWESEVSAICSIPLPITPCSDKQVWHYTKNGTYTVKSGYQLAQTLRIRGAGQEGSSTNQLDLVWQVMWKLKIPEGVKVFLWRVIHEILPTALLLQRRHLLASSVCSRCQGEEETILHAFWSCSKAREVWKLTPFKSAVGRGHYENFKDMFRFATSVLTLNELGLVILICRRIWQARNDAIFNHKLVSPQFLYAQALQLQQDFLEKQLQSSYHAKRPTAQVRWTRPSFPFLKLNVDGAVNVVLGLRGLGAVLRNENGDLLIAVSKGMTGGFSVKATELYAAVLGFQTIIQAGFQSTQIILEMDALGVISDLNAADINWSIEGALVEEVRNLFRFFSSVICTYSPRKCNQAAHTLAKNALLFPAFQVWVEEGPQWLSRVLISDVTI
ncbi:putative ribonuclease H-like domain, reverse transcriptase zinc-binding domain-containing protein [Rosa chinensis]|uniref:Putative ribonuclease H-like domain, reverse transcriptase zinc-binding domain-containing protein n=1 Tax=Rosa chinensis TaxID=74649 RepID=A0A2P6P2U0_ROSCH|nr:putative ribonuclease H-like domain, reverse transcriptase zinc-binding domain-containing protein [Rosa chinensis]